MIFKTLLQNITKTNNMKITIELEGLKCTIENEEAETIHEALYLIIFALKGVGFSDNVINDGIKELKNI